MKGKTGKNNFPKPFCQIRIELGKMLYLVHLGPESDPSRGQRIYAIGLP
jgi:hypothetical protein